MSTCARAKLLLIGPRPLAGEPIGGTMVSFAELEEGLRARGLFEVSVLDTSRHVAGKSHWNWWWRGAAALARALAAIRAARAAGCDAVLFMASSGAAFAAAPAIVAASRRAGLPIALSIWGGNLDAVVERASPRRRRAFERALERADLAMLETFALCRRFRAPNVRWWPTVRALPEQPRAPGGACRRFAFVGQLRPEKGIAEALEASRRLPKDALLEVFGPPFPGLCVDFARFPRAIYRGVLPAAELRAELSGCDALVFPSRYPGEGLPGAIVEALQAGLPVIASRWRSLPELVRDGVEGLLVEPRSSSELAAAMQRLALDDALYARLARAARARGAGLDSALWGRRLERWLARLAGAPAPPARARELARTDETRQLGKAC